MIFTYLRLYWLKQWFRLKIPKNLKFSHQRQDLIKLITDYDELKSAAILMIFIINLINRADLN